MTTSASQMGELGHVIKAARVEREWSQDDLADRAQVSRPSVARVERGDDVSTATLGKIAAALGLSLQLKG